MGVTKGLCVGGSMVVVVVCEMETLHHLSLSSNLTLTSRPVLGLCLPRVQLRKVVKKAKKYCSLHSSVFHL